MNIKNEALKLFFIVVIVTSVIVETLIALTDQGILFLILMWLPALSAIIAVIYETKKKNEKINIKQFLNNLGFRKCKFKYILIGILLSLIYLLISYIFYCILLQKEDAYSETPILSILKDCGPAMIIIVILVFLIMDLGEVIGWINIKQFFNNLGFRKCKFKYILIGILLPLLYLLIPYIIYWIMYPNDFAYNGVSISLILKDCGPVMIIGIFGSLISALGEEIGWRGYLVPTLKELYGEKKSLIISSIFWCVWHLPLIITGSYLSDIPLIYQIPSFILCIFPVGILCGSLALKTNSVWPSAFLHAAHNNYDQSVFQLITRGDKMFYCVSETGIFTIICVWIIMLIKLLIQRKKTNEEGIRNS